MKTNVYILSTGRSGTTLISTILNQLDGNIIIEHQKMGSRLINIISNFPFDTSILLWYLLRVFNRRNSKKPYSSADPLISFAIYKLLRKGYFNGKIIHLVRNPESFVNSFMNWKEQSFRKKILHDFIPFWNLNPLLNDSDVDIKQWISMNNYDKYGWLWNFKNNKYYSLKNLKNSNYILVRMEDLTSRNEDIRINELKKIGNFIGKDWKKEDLINLSFNKINKSRLDTKNYQINDSYKKNSIKYYCKNSASDFGYQL